MRRLMLRISKQMEEIEFMRRGSWEIMIVAAEEIQSGGCDDCMSEGETHVMYCGGPCSPIQSVSSQSNHNGASKQCDKSAAIRRLKFNCAHDKTVILKRGVSSK